MYYIMELILKEFEGIEIIFTPDGWINATDTCKKYGKNLDSFVRTKGFKEYIKSVEKLRYVKKTELKNTVLGKGKEQGTYLHPHLLIYFARYISTDFAVYCDMVIEKGFKKEIEFKQTVITKQQDAIDELVEARDAGKWWLND